MEASTPVTAETLVYAYASGMFPMAEETGEIFWYSPDPRAIIPIQSYKPAKSLRPIINQKRFEIRVDTCFEQVMRNCALPRAYGRRNLDFRGIDRSLHRITPNGISPFSGGLARR